MSLVLVVEQDASYAEQITEALQTQGLEIDVISRAEDVLSYTASRRPKLVLASATFPDAKQILRHFSRMHGGPGAIAIIPINLMGEVSAADLQADAHLAKPFSADDLRDLVAQYLPGPPSSTTPSSTTPPSTSPSSTSPSSVASSAAQQAQPFNLEEQPSAPAPAPSGPESEDSRQLTSHDIFGDVLAEVEAEARSVRPARKKRRPTAEIDIEKRLEETLSGVLDLPSRRPDAAASARPAPPRPRPATDPVPAYSDDEVDQLLDRTLSSLQLPTRPRTAKPAAPTKEAPPPVAATTDLSTPSPPAFEPLGPQAPSAAGLEHDLAGEEAPAMAAMAPPELESPAAPAADSLEPPFFDGPSFDDPDSPTFEGPSFEVHTWEPETGSRAEAASSTDLGHGFDALKTQQLPVLQELADQSSGGVPFGEYSLLRRIALGGMAEVWQARRRGVEGFQKTVAIKKILSHLTDSPDFVTMFIDEAKLAAQLNHNNIIQIYDLGKVGQDYFIAMEYVDGKDLRSILTAGRNENFPLPMGLALMIASRLARALDYAHRKRDFDNRELGLVHRDVSPQNVLISYEAEIKLCDFGIVKAVAKASTTQMGALKGKLQYMSPEQAWGKSVDSRSDIFSLGSVLYEMLIGSKLFTADSEVGVLDAVRDCRISPPSAIVPSIPPAVDNIVLKALAKHPDERYQTAGMMEQEIESFLHDLLPRPSEADLTNYLKQLFVDETSGRVALGRLPDADDRLETGSEVSSGSVTFLPDFSETDDAPERTGTGTGTFSEVGMFAPEPDAPLADSTPTADEAPESLPDAAPVAASAESAGASKKPTKLILAIVILALLAAIAFFVLRSGSNDGPSTPQGSTTPSQSAIPTAADSQENADTPSADSSTSPEPGAAETDDASEAAPAEAEAVQEETGEPSAAEAGESGIPADLEMIVEQELSKREQQLRQEFEARKKRLEAELEAAREAEPPPPSPDGGG